MTTETVNTYLQAFGIISCGLMPYLMIKLYIAVRDYEKVQGKLLKALEQRDTLRDKIESDSNWYQSKIGEMQSKRDKHKQEQSSWAKQRVNLKRRIKELEGE